MLAPIGTGASATVYLSDDVVLRRRVAVKVLHDALADDEQFLKRFRAEAHNAAALNHPHVMAVHDWGQGDVPYLVTELLVGGSLRALLDTGHRLDHAQARQVGLEAARALDYAHRRGLVHRDIKPANLLFDEEGRLRVADFGLARALAEAAWTEPAGAVLGTARYASPEQAQGGALDGRSDVYSLALVLIEAVTGGVPFSADTTLGTLMARVDRPVPVPVDLGPLQSALAAAGVPDPRRTTRRRGLHHDAHGGRRPRRGGGAAPGRHRHPRRRADRRPGAHHPLRGRAPRAGRLRPGDHAGPARHDHQRPHHRHRGRGPARHPHGGADRRRRGSGRRRGHQPSGAAGRAPSPQGRRPPRGRPSCTGARCAPRGAGRAVGAVGAGATAPLAGRRRRGGGAGPARRRRGGGLRQRQPHPHPHHRVLRRRDRRRRHPGAPGAGPAGGVHRAVLRDDRQRPRHQPDAGARHHAGRG